MGAAIIAWVTNSHGGTHEAGVGAWVPLGAYMALLSLVSVVTTFYVPEPRGRDLDDPRDAVQRALSMP